MCEEIRMHDGTKIESIREDGTCLCNSTTKEIMMWIVDHVHDIGICEQLEIEHTPFGWEVRVAREGCTYHGFNACTDLDKYEIPPGERMDFYMVICPIHGEWCTTFEPTKGGTCEICNREVKYRLLPWGRANDQI